MEWLQTYKIGKSLIESGKYSWENAYHGSYYPPYIKDSRERKTPYVLEVIIDITSNQVKLNSRQLDGFELEPHENKNPFVEEGYFTSVAGNFTSYYLCTPYGKEKSILDFFGIKDGKLVVPKKKNELIGFEKEFTQLISGGLLVEKFKESRLLKIRKTVREQETIIQELNTILTNLKLFTELSQQKAFDKKFPKRKNLISSRLNTAPRGNADIAFVVVKIIDKENPKGFYLNREKEAKDFYSNRFLNLAKIDSNNLKKGPCYFNGEANVYNVSLPRDNVTILKINTNSSTTDSNLQGSPFSISQNAYDQLKLGSWFLAKKMTVRIANIQHYIIPDFVDTFEILKYKSELTSKVEIVFKEAEYDRMKKRLFRLSNQNINSISFVGFEKDPKFGTIDVINRIQIVEPDYFNFLFETFQKTQEKIAEIADTKCEELSHFTLASSYRLFPIPTSNPKKNTALHFFKMLFEKTPVPIDFLMDNYKKLIKLFRYGKEDDKKKIRGKSSFAGCLNIPFEQREYYDNAIGRVTLKYLILINFINQLNNQSNMEKNIGKINKTEQFFEISGYSDFESKKALFYLGRLIRRVAEAQSKQGNSKAILEKVNYSGMTIEDVQWLSCEVFEKLKQYNRGKAMTLKYGKDDWDSFSKNISKATAKGQSSWKLTEMENVFYLLTGYGMYWQTKEEIPEPEAPENGVKEEVKIA